MGTGTVVARGVSTLLLLALVHGATAATFSITPANQSVTPGENFTVNVTVDPEGSTITGAEYVLCCNQSLLTATSVTPGALFTGFSTYQYSEINHSLGTVEYGELILGGDSGVTSPGTLATIAFQAIALHGLIQLEFQNVTVSYKVPANASNGTVQIGICGDVNNDDKVTMGDGRLVYLNAIYGDDTCPLANPWAADVNCDGKITMGDGRLIYLHVIHGEVAYPLGCC
jgi:hypothetical protein